MNSEYKDFIGTYYDVFEDGFCEHVIDEFERLNNFGVCQNRISTDGAARHFKDDLQISLNYGVHTLANFKNKSVEKAFFDGLQKCYDEYSSKYSILQQSNIRGTSLKLQCTPPGGGYHLWHSEQGPGPHAGRVLVYMLYLNTLSDEEAGETEFLYQQRRIQPKKNVMILWPASFTHTHRGNTVFGEKNKYIITGWFYYE